MGPRIRHTDYALPLLSGIVEGNAFHLRSYLGGCFYVSSDGWLATCKHNIERKPRDERIALIIDEYPDQRFPVIDVRCHPTRDFALARVEIASTQFWAPDCTDNLLGRDVQVFGTTYAGKVEEEHTLENRLFKGYVVRHDDDTAERHGRSNSTCVMSFPCLHGFAGYPVVHHDMQRETIGLVGMLYGNHKLRIEQSTVSDLQEEGQHFQESVHRVVEGALAHTASDIRDYADDLAVSGLFQ